MDLNGRSLYTTQGFKHIRALLDHGSSESLSGKYIRACIERLKFKVGTGSSFFCNNFNTFQHCATKTWISHTWKYMWEKKIVVKERTSNLELQQENDKFLMKEFVKHGYNRTRLANLNQCHQYLQATSLSDITYGDGRKILKGSIEGHKHFTHQRYQWAPQRHPNPNLWTKWAEALYSAFDIQ
eukprot:14943120-Ditylum_brightwellii.AAC.1